ncbi:JmjC domain-containing protein [Streptacidiphilus pinicola]|uniref:JmjC domain-containing protein n=1 Tax=Streptacidiphilus pinicola TaxID=2219663 RepID=UPI0014024214|nr:cupin domain-containing protein [Streptacidiphilus pinicola]
MPTSQAPDSEDQPVLPLLGDPARFAQGWPRTPYRRVGTAAPLRSVLSWSDLDDLVNRRTLQTPAFRMARNGSVLPIGTLTRAPHTTTQNVTGLADSAAILRELGEGATLILQGLNRSWSPIGALSRRLSSEIGHAVFVNAYLTPRATQGFGAHQDSQHAWLVQCQGSKTWQLWAPDDDPEHDPPDWTLQLDEGDVLWIPRGWWHSGSSGDRPSLHLTFAVWATTVQDVLKSLTSELAFEPALAEELPPRALHEAAAARSAVGETAVRLAELLARTDVPGLTQRLLTTHLQRFDPLPGPDLAGALGVDDPMLHAHPEAVLHTAVDGPQVRLRTADSEVVMTAEQAAACRTLLARTGGFRPDERDRHRLGDKLLGQLVDARLLCSGHHG